MSQMYNTKTFADLYEDYDTFKEDHVDNAFLPCVIDHDDGTEQSPKVSNLQILYYLAFSKFGNNPIANLDENQFKAKFEAVMWQYGPAWESKLKIQDKIRTILNDNTETDLLQGSKAIHNHAFNPATDPSTGSLEELTYINDQNTTQYKKSKMDAYGQLWGLIATDVTEEFLARFKPLFQKAINLKPYLFESED